MREIKFRGKSDNDWAYGYLLKVDEISQAEHEHFNYFIQSDFIQLEEYVEYYITDDNTIGQFTGLHDKNGKEIYEGDIVKANFFNKEITGKIEFAFGAFFVTGSAVSDNQMFIFSDYEVIGNIYENPELLEKGEIK